MISYYKKSVSKLVSIHKLPTEEIWKDKDATIKEMLTIIYNFEGTVAGKDDEIAALRCENDRLGCELITTKKHKTIFMGIAGILMVVVGILLII